MTPTTHLRQSTLEHVPCVCGMPAGPDVRTTCDETSVTCRACLVVRALDDAALRDVRAAARAERHARARQDVARAPDGCRGRRRHTYRRTSRDVRRGH